MKNTVVANLGLLRRVCLVFVGALVLGCAGCLLRTPGPDEVRCSLVGTSCQRQGNDFCAPGGQSVRMQVVKCFNSLMQSGFEACQIACNGLRWTMCTPENFVVTTHSPNCGTSTAPLSENQLVIGIAPNTKVTIRSPTLGQTLTTKLTSGQIVLSRPSNTSFPTDISDFDTLKEFRLGLKEVSLCLSPKRISDLHGFKDLRSEPKTDESNARRSEDDDPQCQQHFSSIEIANANAAQLRFAGNRDSTEAILPAGAVTFLVSFLINGQPSSSEVPSTGDLAIQISGDRKQAHLIGNFDLRFGAILLDVDVGKARQLDH